METREIEVRSANRIVATTESLADVLQDWEVLKANGDLYERVLDAWAELEVTVQREHLR